MTKTPIGLFILADLSDASVSETVNEIKAIISQPEIADHQSDLPIPVRVFDFSASKTQKPDSKLVSNLLAACERPLILAIIKTVPLKKDNPAEVVEAAEQSNRDVCQFAGQLRNIDTNPKPDFLAINLDRTVAPWKAWKACVFHESEDLEIEDDKKEDEMVDMKHYFLPGQKVEASVRHRYVAIRVCFALHQIARELGPQGGTNGNSDSAKIFISHTKIDAVPLATSFRGQFAAMPWLKKFYDVEVIKPGDDWRKTLEDGVRDSLLLVLRTNAYDERPWCRQEMMWAEEMSRPVVVIDARTRLKTPASSLPFSACPSVAIPDGDTLKVFEVCAREILRVSLAHAEQPVEHNTWFIPRTPSIPALYRIIENAPADESLVVVYAGPPLENGFRLAAEKILESKFPTGKLLTTTEFRSFASISNRLNP